MIIQFTVENFLSFKEQTTLSLVASALKEKQSLVEDVVFELDGANISLLKSAVVYGANASGKSNLVKALNFFKWFVINSSKGYNRAKKFRWRVSAYIRIQSWSPATSKPSLLIRIRNIDMALS